VRQMRLLHVLVQWGLTYDDRHHVWPLVSDAQIMRIACHHEKDHDQHRSDRIR
jgi:hypothetical protein